MSFEAAEAAVRKYFVQKWGTATPIKWPDLHFIPPAATWVAFHMMPNLGYQASTGSPGSNVFRREGIITIQVFQPEGQAGTDARKKADLAASAFLSPNSLAGFTFKNVVAKPAHNGRGITGLNGTVYYQWNVTAEYQHDIIT